MKAKKFFTFDYSSKWITQKTSPAYEAKIFKKVIKGSIVTRVSLYPSFRNHKIPQIKHSKVFLELPNYL